MLNNPPKYKWVPMLLAQIVLPSLVSPHKMSDFGLSFVYQPFSGGGPPEEERRREGGVCPPD